VKLDTRNFHQTQRWDADVCIMGGGVAGITLANELSKKGISVILLEAGGDDHDPQVQKDAEASSVHYPYPDPSQSRLRRLGGTSNHWANNTSPLSPIDFEARDGLPESGWPITFETLSPYYEKAGVYCGVGSDGYDLQHWLKTFDIQSTVPNGGTEGVRLAIAKASLPPTQFYRAHGAILNRRAAVKVITYAQVTGVRFAPSSQRVEQVQVMGANGIYHTVDAQEVVMALGGLENARMLLHFNREANNALGNQHDVVGRYFMDHPTVRGAQLFTKTPEVFRLFSGEVPSDYRRFVLNFFELTERRLREHQLTNIRMPLTKASRQQLSRGVSSFHLLKERLQGQPASGTILSHLTNVVMDLDIVADTVSRKVLHQPLFESVDDFGGFEVPLMMEQTPHRDNRVVLSPEKDRFGIPKMSIEWQLHAADKKRLWRGLEVFAAEIGALGLGRVRSLADQESRIFGNQIGFGHHHMGTTRMASIPEKGVVDAEQRVFGTANLSVAGCSVFSTGGHVPPTLTIVATSLRLAEIIHRRVVKKQGVLPA
jgi:choline dehydrogenase-like flavoprotein